MSRFRVRDLDPRTLLACAAELERVAEVAEAAAQFMPSLEASARGKRLIAARWRARAKRIEKRRARP